MKKPIFTHTFEEKGQGVIEVDFDLTLFIYEIRVWSEHFEAYVPVSELWLKANLPVRYKKLLNKVYEAAHVYRQPKPKEFNNDDLPPAA